jgi:hypothetical protein
MRIKAYVFLFFLVCGLQVQAQQLDTVKYSKELSYFITETGLDQFDTNRVFEDTTFDKTYRLNPYRTDETFHLDLGPLGTPAYSFQERFKINQLFDLGFHTMDAYQSDPKNTKYYYSNTPRSLLKYSQGSQDLLYLKAEHSQKLSELWSVGIDYRRIKSNNIYFGNLTDFLSTKIPNSFNTKLYSRFHSPNRRYEILVNAYFDKNTLNETGGIVDRAHFDTLIGREKHYFNLAQNSSATNTLKHQGVYIKQYYRLGSYPETIVQYDSINTDSIISVTLPETSTHGQLFHEIQFEKNHALYEDPNPNRTYYGQFLFSGSTLDSLEQVCLRNTIGIVLDRKLKPRIKLNHEIVSINQNGLMKAQFQNLSANLDLEKELGTFTIAGSVGQHFTGYNAGDQHISLNVLNKSFKLLYNYSRFEPSYASKYFVSNHVYWYNNWDKTNIQSLGLEYNIGELLQVSLAQRTLSNWIIYGANAQPVQIAENISVTTASFKNRLKLGHWHLNSHVEYNEISDNRLPTPRWSVKESFYYERPLFKKSMPAQIGLDFYFQTEFEGLTYYPVTRQYQLSPGNFIGNYALFDAFFSAKVGHLKLFAIVQHVNEDFMGNAYYSAANYPMMPFSFRLGVEWRLFD